MFRIRSSLLLTLVALLISLGIASQSLAREAYVANFDSNSVSAFDTDTGDARGTVFGPTPPSPAALFSVGLVTNPGNESRAYVTFIGAIGTDQVVAMDAASKKVLTTIPVGSDPVGVYFTPDGSRAYIPNWGATSVSVINTSTDQPAGAINLSKNPKAVAFTPDGNRAYVTNGSGGPGANQGTVSVVDTNPGSPNYHAIITEIAMLGTPASIAITPDGTRAYVVNMATNSVEVIDTDPGSSTYNQIIYGADPTELPVGNFPSSMAMTPDGTRAYVANEGSDSVTVIDTDPTSLTYNTVLGTFTVAGMSYPNPVVVTPDGSRVYLVNDKSPGLVQVFTRADIDANPTGPTPIASIGVGDSPDGVAVLPNGKEVWVGDDGNGDSISVIDSDPASGTYNTVTDTITSFVRLDMPNGAAITPDGTRAYVANSNGDNVWVIDTETKTITTTVAVGNRPISVAISPDGSRAYVSNEGSANVSVIDTATNKVVATIGGLGSKPSGIAITPDGSRAYVGTRGTSSVQVIDTTTSSVVATVAVGTDPTGIAITPDGSRAYVTNEGSDSVSVVDTATNTVADTIPSLAYKPYGVAITPDGSRAYVTNRGAWAATVIDTATGSVASTISGLGGKPAFIALTPDGKRAFVSNFADDTLSVVDTSTGAATGTINTGKEPHGVAVVPDRSPTAQFSVNAGVSGEQTSFNAGDSSDPDGTVARYDWDFGDGTTLQDGGPTPSHVYQQSGNFTVWLTVYDDEGCSGSVFTGQTAYCTGSMGSGSGTARTSYTVTIQSGDGECSNTLETPVPSVSHWKRVKGRLSLRLKAYPGGYALKPNKRSLFALEVRRIRGEANRRLDRVKFYIDGARIKTDRKAPYLFSLDPADLSPGYHTLKARVYSRFGTKRTLKLDFLASNCEGAAFSVGLSSKRPRTYPKLVLRARTGGSELKQVRFKLSRFLKFDPRGLRGRRMGLIRLRGTSGSKGRQNLKMLSRSKGKATLAGSGALKASLNTRAKRPSLTVKGLSGSGATGLQVMLYGSKTRLIQNPGSCKRRHKFTATLTSTEGDKATLKRSLKMCKTSL